MGYFACKCIYFLSGAILVPDVIAGLSFPGAFL